MKDKSTCSAPNPRRSHLTSTLHLVTITMSAALWLFVSNAGAAVIDFSTDPNIAGDWTEYSYFGAEDVTPAWNSVDEDLDLAGGGATGRVLGLYQTGLLRAATDPIRLTVNEFSQAGGTWGQVGLMISTIAQPNLLDSNTKYEWMVRYEASNLLLRVRKDVGSGAFELYDSLIGAALPGPLTLEILRVGDDYQFLANNTLHYTADGAGLDVYNTATKNSLLNYGITFGGDDPALATIDNFGIAATPVPEPGSLILAGIGLLGLIACGRRRKAAA